MTTKHQNNKKRTGMALLKLGVAVLLLLCLADMPYGFYNIVRVLATAAFAYLAFDYFRAGRDAAGFCFTALAVLFQPFVKIALGRTIWNIVDVTVAALLVWLIISAFRRK